VRRPASPFVAVYRAGVSPAFFEAALRRRRDSDPWLCLFMRPAGLVVANERYDGNLGGFLSLLLSIVRASNEHWA
jgi:hypothetical protein